MGVGASAADADEIARGRARVGRARVALAAGGRFRSRARGRLGLDFRHRPRLSEGLGDLPAEQRRVLVAAFYEGLSHAEIAARDGLTLGTVKSRIRLAFRHLHGVLGDDLAEGFGDD